MKFYQRLAYYLSGFSLGIFFLVILLNGKDTSCSYFPNARVLKNIRSKSFSKLLEDKNILKPSHFIHNLNNKFKS